jgi:hypothetical protein
MYIRDRELYYFKQSVWYHAHIIIAMYILLVALLLSLPSLAELAIGRLPESFVEPAHNPPPWQVHAYNHNTYILRQSGLTDYEKPFCYLLFGDDRAYLLDTGSLYVLH